MNNKNTIGSYQQEHWSTKNHIDDFKDTWGEIDPHAREEHIEPRKGAKNQLTQTEKLIE